MYALYQETAPSTSVHESLSCNFMDARTPQLVTHSGTRLRVYRTNPYALERKVDGGDWQPTTKLECMLSVKLHAAVRSMCSAKLPNSILDCLLLAFDDAKLSVVVYDALNHDITTVSLHCFEEPSLRCGYTKLMQTPIVVADPESRCAAMLVFGRHIAVLPLTAHQDMPIDDLLFDPVNKQKSLSTNNAAVKLHSYVTKLTDIEERLANVTDMCFLHGYYEPTLLLLYEPLQTTVGRLAIRMDTYCIVAMSLRVKDKEHAIIWTVNQLPYDCFRVQAVPRPVAGCIVTCASSVIYLNQSVPSYGVSVNGGYRNGQCTSFPMHAQTDLRLPLDASASAFLSPTCMLIATRDRRFAAVQLLIDDTSIVRGVRVERCGEVECVPPTTMSMVEGHIFVGSHLAHSILLSYREHDVHSVVVTNEEDGASAAKKGRFDSSPYKKGTTDEGTNGTPSSAIVVDPVAFVEVVTNKQDAIDKDIYGEVQVTKTVDTLAAVQYQLEVLHQIYHPGPLKQMSLSVPAYSPEHPLHRLNTTEPVFDECFAAGHAGSGAVVTMQRSLRPSIITTTMLRDATSLHTCGRNSKDAQKYLLVSRTASTLVLEVGEEIVEVERSPFLTDQSTIAAFDMFDGQYTVQVCPMHIAVIRRGDARTQTITLDIAFPVRQASYAEPYLLLLTENGHVLMAKMGDADGDALRTLTVEPLTTLNTTMSSAASIYKDLSGMFSLSTGVHNIIDEATEPAVRVKKQEEEQTSEVRLSVEEDDEDALLYGAPVATLTTRVSPMDEEALPAEEGEESKTMRSTMGQTEERAEVLFEGQLTGNSCRLHDPATVAHTYWIVRVTENGRMEVYSLPDLVCVFTVGNVTTCEAVLKDAPTIDISGQDDASMTPLKPSSSRVHDVAIASMGVNGCRPHFVIVVDQLLCVYEAFACNSIQVNRLCVRLRRNDVATLPIRNDRLTERTVEADDRQDGQRIFTSGSIGKCQNVCVFMSGAYPVWLVMETNELRVHPMNLEVPHAVCSFAPFNNADCERGFVYLTGEHKMRVATLDPRFNYDTVFPIWHSAQSQSIHFVQYMIDSHVMAVCSSSPSPNAKLYNMVGDEKAFEPCTIAESDDMIQPTIENYKVTIHSMDDMTPLANAGTIELQEYETVTCMKQMQLRSEASHNGMANFLCLGTIHNFGEEVLTRGRLFVIEIIEVVAEEGVPNTRHRLKTLLCRDEKAPVTSLACVNAHLLTGMGQKVYIWAWRDNELQGVSFIDMAYYIHQLVGFRDICLSADIQRSISLLRFQERIKTLSIASMDVRTAHVQGLPMGIDFVVDGSQLSFLSTDEDCNVTLSVFAPDTRESHGGQRMVVRGELNIASRVNCIERIGCRHNDAINRRDEHLLATRNCNVFGTLDGGCGVLVPLTDRTYRKLEMLHTVMCTQLSHTAGLHPRGATGVKGYRQYKSALNVSGVMTTPRAILDGDLLYEYLHLSTGVQHDIAKRLGTTRLQLNDDLLAVQRSTHHS